MSSTNIKNIGGIDWNVQYMVIWAALLGFTLIEVFIPEMSGTHEMFGIQLPRTVGIVSLITLATIKTFLVAWYYMHLIGERPLLILIACAPFIFSIFLTIGLFPW